MSEHSESISIPGHTILSTLGEGGMGAVYKAHQERLDRIVAIKVLARQLTSDPSFKERFENEARALAKLIHPNVVSIYDSGETEDGLAYFIMEFVEGANAFAYLQDNGPLESKSLVGIMASVCDALASAHEMGLIHRDIKPGNVLLKSDGRVKVADFGLATLGTQHEGEIYGTPGYSAPELYHGTGDHRLDIYALGAMLMHLATGIAPDVLASGVHAMPPGFDTRVKKIAERAMDPDPAKRYQDAQAMKADILMLLQPPLTRATVRVGGVAHRPLPPVQTSSRGGGGGGGLLLVLSLLALGGAAVYYFSQKKPDKPTVNTSTAFVNDTHVPAPVVTSAATKAVALEITSNPDVWSDDFTSVGFTKKSTLSASLPTPSEAIGVNFSGQVTGAINVKFIDDKGKESVFTLTGGNPVSGAWDLPSTGSALKGEENWTSVNIVASTSTRVASVNDGKITVTQVDTGPIARVEITADAGIQLRTLECLATDLSTAQGWLSSGDYPRDSISEERSAKVKLLQGGLQTILQGSKEDIATLFEKIYALKINDIQPIKPLAAQLSNEISALTQASKALASGEAYDALKSNPSAFVGSNGNAYVLLEGSAGTDFRTASETATRWGGHLPTITTKSESDEIHAFLLKAHPSGNLEGFWLGAQPEAGFWTWVTGETFPSSAPLPKADFDTTLAYLPFSGDVYEWRKPTPDDKPKVMIEFPAPGTNYPREQLANLSPFRAFLARMTQLWTSQNGDAYQKAVTDIGKIYKSALASTMQTASPSEQLVFQNELADFEKTGKVSAESKPGEPPRLRSLRTAYLGKLGALNRELDLKATAFLAILKAAADDKYRALPDDKKDDGADFQNWLSNLSGTTQVSAQELTNILNGTELDLDMTSGRE